MTAQIIDGKTAARELSHKGAYEAVQSEDGRISFKMKIC